MQGSPAVEDRRRRQPRFGLKLHEATWWLSENMKRNWPCNGMERNVEQNGTYHGTKRNVPWNETERTVERNGTYRGTKLERTVERNGTYRGTKRERFTPFLGKRSRRATQTERTVFRTIFRRVAYMHLCVMSCDITWYFYRCCTSLTSVVAS